MGAFADGFAAYVQPLIDETDGSPEQLNKAVALGQFCYKLALSPAESRDESLNGMRQSLKMSDAEFEMFQKSIVVPMLERHEEMFPRLHQRTSIDRLEGRSSSQREPRIAAPAEVHPATDRYAPCPCNSGKKHKFCCGMKRR